MDCFAWLCLSVAIFGRVENIGYPIKRVIVVLSLEWIGGSVEKGQGLLENAPFRIINITFSTYTGRGNTFKLRDVLQFQLSALLPVLISDSCRRQNGVRRVAKAG